MYTIEFVAAVVGDLAALRPYDRRFWELRVGEYRVFYDVQEQARLVTVRAIRLKPPHKTTEEIL